MYSRCIFVCVSFRVFFLATPQPRNHTLQHHLRYRLRVIHRCVGGGCDLLLPSNQAPTTTHQQYQRPHPHHTHATHTTFTSTTKHKPPTTHITHHQVKLQSHPHQHTHNPHAHETTKNNHLVVVFFGCCIVYG